MRRPRRSRVGGGRPGGRAITAGLAVFGVAAVAVHLTLLLLAPAWATRHQIREGLRRGARMNAFTYAKPPRAGATSVPLANADTLGVRGYLDLRDGPLIVEGLRPQGCAYWSVSVFAENTDTLLIRSDRDLPDRRVAVGLRTATQRFTEPVRDAAVLPTPTGVVLIRCFMRVRDDPAYVARLAAENRGLVLRPMRRPA